MTPLLLALLVAVLLPHFLGGWRANLAALGAQGLLMGALALAHDPAISADLLLTAVDLFLVRGVLVPFALYRAMASGDPRRDEAVPANMLSWALVTVLVAAAFRFAHRMEPAAGEPQTALAVAAAALLLGFFGLSMQTSPFGQAVAALRVENAVFLFELSHHASSPPMPVRVGLLGAFVLTVLMFASYVRRLAEAPGAEPAADGASTEEPAL